MEGVVLFADDHIHSTGRPENALFNEINKTVPVVGVDSLDLAERAVDSVGSFSAIILDWQFTNEVELDLSDIEEELGQLKAIQVTSEKEDAAFNFLKENDIYSLIYIFSEKDIEETHGEKLRGLFGDRVRIEQKTDFTLEKAGDFKEKILKDIEDWKKENENLSVPISWSSSINEAIQKIFKELSDADENWIKEIYDSASNDGTDPEPFVIHLLQLLLSESLVQNHGLISSIKTIGGKEAQEIPESKMEEYQKSLSKLFSRLFYSKLSGDAPLMTGDICALNEESYGVLITPECDIKHIQSDDSNEFEFLAFSTDDFDDFLLKQKSYNRSEEEYVKFKDKRKEGLRTLFNQELSRFHFLPSAPFLDEDYCESAVINFRTANVRLEYKQVKEFRREYKINSPFVEQLRQRYLSYIGRVGTPALPKSVRDWNLS